MDNTEVEQATGMQATTQQAGEYKRLTFQRFNSRNIIVNMVQESRAVTGGHRL